MIKLNEKINLGHSIIFFLTSCLFSIIIKKFEGLVISPAVCLFFILSIGISHGALDNIKGKKFLISLNIKEIYKFYIGYLILSLGVIISWIVIPTFSLILFLIVASYHFGKEDTDFLIISKTKLNLILYFFKGLLIVVAPLIFNFTETMNIFKLLLVENENFYSFLGYVEEKNILYMLLLISLFTNLFYLFTKFKISNFVLLFDFFSVIILNYFLSPLVAFTIYFCFLHSFRHSISLIIELDDQNFKNGFFAFCKKALPLTILTAFFYLISLYFLFIFYEINDAILKIIFIGLASLTFPHILLEYLLEKNEK